MMHLTNTLYYAECAQWQAVSLPFKDHAVVFELVVPRKGQSLKDAEKALLTGDILKKRNAERVQLSMPAFKVSGAHRLRAPLNALGMRDAFINGRANFTGIDNKQPLFLGNVMHGVWIAVDERGVEAAAATALMSKCGAVKIAEPPKRILADRPFAFAMRDQRTGLLLFVGRLNDPTVGA